LLEQPVTAVINDTAFVHGGLGPLLAAVDPAALNAVVRDRLHEMLALRSRLVDEALVAADLDGQDAAEQLERPDLVLTEQQQALARRFIELVGDPLFADEGPFWYRGNAQCHALIEEHNLAGVFRAWDIARVIVGHTPTLDHRVHERLGGKVVLADTGMLASHYGGRASAVVIEGGRLSVRYASQPGSVPPVTEAATPLDPLAESEVVAALGGFQPAAPDGEAWETLTIAPGQQVAARFTAAAGRARNAELAAMRLDRLLGLNLVVPVTSVRHGGREGLAVAAWPGVISEEQRAATQGSGPPACAGASVLELLYAFDALIGNEGRSARTIIYEPRTRRLGSLGHGDSFGRGARFPDYLERTPQTLPAALASRLAGIDEAVLQAELGELLSGRQIRAVLARRDRLLSEWAVEG
jgi:hypothetical protein